MRVIIVIILANSFNLISKNILDAEDFKNELQKIYYIDIQEKENIREESLKIKEKINQYSPKLVSFYYYWLKKEDKYFIRKLNYKYKTISGFYSSISENSNYVAINRFHENYKGVIINSDYLSFKNIYITNFKNPIDEVLESSELICGTASNIVKQNLYDLNKNSVEYNEQSKESYFVGTYYTEYGNYLIENCSIILLNRLLEKFSAKLEYDLGKEVIFLNYKNQKKILDFGDVKYGNYKHFPLDYVSFTSKEFLKERFIPKKEAYYVISDQNLKIGFPNDKKGSINHLLKSQMEVLAKKILEVIEE
jgi:hypothetical protein